MTSFSNDNGMPRVDVHDRDAYGHAALLLVESLLHGLIEQSVFSVHQAVEIVEIAVEVKSELARELGDSPAALQRSLGLLASIRSSLQHDERS